MDLRHHAVADKRFETTLTGAGDATPSDAIQMTSYAPNRLDYTTALAEPRVAVFSEIYYPHDWHIYVDEKEVPLARVNYMLRAAVIPAGEHNIQMEFKPSALTTDKWSMACVILLLLISMGLVAYPFCKTCMHARKA